MKLPAISGHEALLAFLRAGYEVDRQRGSHVVLRHLEPPYRRLTIPLHRQLAKGTLRTLIREAGLTVEQFVELLRSQSHNKLMPVPIIDSQNRVGPLVNACSQQTGAFQGVVVVIPPRRRLSSKQGELAVGLPLAETARD